MWFPPRGNTLCTCNYILKKPTCIFLDLFHLILAFVFCQWQNHFFLMLPCTEWLKPVQCHPDHMHIVQFMLQHKNIFCVIRLWLFVPQIVVHNHVTTGALPDEKSLNCKPAKYTLPSTIQLVEKIWV